jgi:thiosulfate/3-mercaptopyruvate sulfurtransferase
MATAPFSRNPELSTKSALVSCEWLRQNLDRPNQVILDATFFLPRQQRNSQEEFRLEHIPGAQLFNIDEIADLNSRLPHTLPDADQFAQQMGQMGIDNDTWVLIYDNNHFFASARAWWMFRVFEHDNVKIVDGGLTRWKHLSFPLTSDTIKPVPKMFNAEFDSELMLDLEKMQIVQQQGSKLILDARSEDSFNGQRQLYDTGLQPGHIPGSNNIPYQKLFAKDDHTLLPVVQLRQVISDAAVDLSKPMVTSCGSGVSAALLLLALYQIGIHEVPMFDGSWAQWGRQTNLPRQTKS